MNPDIDILAQVFALILSWPEPGKTAPGATLTGTPEAAETEPAQMGGSALIVHPQGENHDGHENIPQ